MWSGKLRRGERRGRRVMRVPTFSCELIKYVQRRTVGSVLTCVAPRRAWPNRAARSGCRLVLTVTAVEERGRRSRPSKLSPLANSDSSGTAPRPKRNTSLPRLRGHKTDREQYFPHQAPLKIRDAGLAGRPPFLL